MKVPTLSGRGVGQAQAPGYQPQQVSPDFSIARGVNELGRGVQALGAAVGGQLDEQQRAEERARAEARSLTETDKLLEQHERAQRRLLGDSSSKGRIDDAFEGGDTSTGFLATRGLGASEKSADTIDALVKDREEIAATIGDPLAKQRFLLKSREQLLAYRGQVEKHASQQYGVAVEVTLKARQQQAIGMAESGIPDFEGWLTVSRQTESAIDELAPSKPAAEALKSAFRADNAFAMTRGMLAQGRAEEAAKYVEENRATLGGNYTEAAAAVSKGVEKVRAQQAVAGIIDKSKGEDGYVDESKAVAAFRELDTEEQLKAGPAFTRALAQEAKAHKAAKDGWHDQVGNQFNAGGFASIDAALLESPLKDPDYLRSLRNEDEIRQARALRRAKGGHTSKGELVNDKLWLTRFKAQGTTGMAEASVEDFVVGHGVTELGVAQMQVLQQQAKERVGKAEGSAQQAMQTEAEAQLRALPKLKKRPGGLTEDDVAEFRADAFDRFDEFVAEKKRPPNSEERAAMISNLLLKQEVTTQKSFLGIPYKSTTEKRGFQVSREPGANPPPPTKPVTIRRKSDGKSRTVSPAEAARFLADPNFEQVN